jgi:AraC-like DNA-binding protein
MDPGQEQPSDSAIRQATTIGSVAGLIEKALRTYGCDPAPLFAAAGIPPGTAGNPDTRIPTLRGQALWKYAIEATADPCFGLTAAQQFQPAALHGLGFAWLASDTLRDAFDRLARFARFLNPLFRIEVEDGAHTVDLVIQGREWPDFEFAALDLAMAVFVRMCQITVGEHVVPLCVLMRRPAPPCAERFAACFAAPVEYRSADNRLCFEPELVKRPLQTGNPELARINDQAVVDYLARFDRANITMQVRAGLIERLPGGTPDQASIAQALHISPRSLQRRLRGEQTSFRSLLDETRRELAMQYIRQGHRPLGEVAFLLGFSEPGNFTRAFRRWTGLAPKEFRAQA